MGSARFRARNGCRRSASSMATPSSINTNGCGTSNRRTFKTTWRHRTATANSAWHRSHRCAKRCSRNSSRMCRKPTCPCRRAWTATGTSPAPCRGGNTPRNAACRSAARTIGIRRQWRPACHSTANRWCSIRRRGARPRFLPHRRHGHFQGRPLDAVRHRHDWRRTLRFPHP